MQETVEVAAVEVATEAAHAVAVFSAPTTQMSGAAPAKTAKAPRSQTPHAYPS